MYRQPLHPITRKHPLAQNINSAGNLGVEGDRAVLVGSDHLWPGSMTLWTCPEFLWPVWCHKLALNHREPGMTLPLSLLIFQGHKCYLVNQNISFYWVLMSLSFLPKGRAHSQHLTPTCQYDFTSEFLFLESLKWEPQSHPGNCFLPRKCLH